MFREYLQKCIIDSIEMLRENLENERELNEKYLVQPCLLLLVAPKLLNCATRGPPRVSSASLSVLSSELSSSEMSTDILSRACVKCENIENIDYWSNG